MLLQVDSKEAQTYSKRLGFFRSVFFFALAVSWPAYASDPARYLRATLASLDCLRDKNGLVRDKAQLTNGTDACPLLIQFAATSPTNLALDLLIQLEVSPRKQLPAILNSIARLDVHAETGLYFARYVSQRVVDDYLSAIDNSHLALAFWTIAQTLPNKVTGALAQRLLARMNFGAFYIPEHGLFNGGLRRESDGVWRPEAWTLGYFGSESRTLYALAYALGWIDDENFLQKFLRSASFDVFDWRGHKLLGLWDGGAFQLLLPRLLLNEARYSTRFGDYYRNYAEFIRAEGVRRGLPLPAAHSACEFANDYNGRAGNLALTASQNVDDDIPTFRARWEQVVTPHALMLAWVAGENFDPHAFVDAEYLGRPGRPLYDKRVGWMDGYDVATGEVVPSILSLNQGMIALSLLAKASADGDSPSARHLFANDRVRERLARFYSAIDAWLSGAALAF